MINSTDLQDGIAVLILVSLMLFLFLYKLDYQPSKARGIIKEDVSFWKYLGDFFQISCRSKHKTGQRED